MNRRRVLLTGAAGALAASAFGSPSQAATLLPSRRPVGEPFMLGVASGDPLSDGVVLWTRLAPNPLAGDGRGGMPDRPVPVQWEVAADENFRRLAARGTTVARPELAHSVHVEVGGLRPGAEYFYRFRSGSETSPVGRTKTAPDSRRRLDRLTFAFASCQNWEAGYYTAYRDIARHDLDLVVHLGDYIYEGFYTGGVREHLPAREVVSLADYRIRYAQYKTDGDLQAAHAAFPWLVTLDDHDVDNNWAGDIPQDPGEQTREEFLARRAAAFQAYYEHQPLRRSALPRNTGMRLYRRFTFGDLAEFNVLDTRQYRTDQPSALEGAYDPAATMTGVEQENWLIDGLEDSTVRWNVLAQQTRMAQDDLTPGPGESYGLDAWDGYRVQRQRLMDYFASGRTRQPVVITGDQHRNLVSNLKQDFDDSESETVGAEFLGTSISSAGDNPTGEDEGGEQQVAENPHIKYAGAQRGYVLVTLTPDLWRSDFRVVPIVSRPGGRVSTDATLVVEDGIPGVQTA